jgi:hypothetical protein
VVALLKADLSEPVRSPPLGQLAAIGDPGGRDGPFQGPFLLFRKALFDSTREP